MSGRRLLQGGDLANVIGDQIKGLKHSEIGENQSSAQNSEEPYHFALRLLANGNSSGMSWIHHWDY